MAWEGDTWREGVGSWRKTWEESSSDFCRMSKAFCHSSSALFTAVSTSASVIKPPAHAYVQTHMNTARTHTYTHDTKHTRPSYQRPRCLLQSSHHRGTPRRMRAHIGAHVCGCELRCRDLLRCRPTCHQGCASRRLLEATLSAHQACRLPVDPAASISSSLSRHI